MILLLILLLTLNLQAQTPIDSFYISGSVNGLAYSNGHLIVATGNGILRLPNQYLSVDSVDAVMVCGDTIFSISNTQWLEKRTMQGDLFYRCCIESLYPNSGNEVGYAGMVYDGGVWFLRNFRINTSPKGFYKLDGCNIVEGFQTDPVLQQMRLRGWHRVDGDDWIGLKMSKRLVRLNAAHQPVDTLIFYQYGNELLAWTPTVNMNRLWLAFADGERTKLILFDMTSKATPRFDPRKLQLNIRPYPNPTTSLASVIYPKHFITYNILGRQVRDPVSAGHYIIVEKASQSVGKLVITK